MFELRNVVPRKTLIKNNATLPERSIPLSSFCMVKVYLMVLLATWQGSEGVVPMRGHLRLGRGSGEDRPRGQHDVPGTGRSGWPQREHGMSKVFRLLFLPPS